MAHRELLTESQRVFFHAPATDERGMVRHYTLSADDLALIDRRRSDPNRLVWSAIIRSKNSRSLSPPILMMQAAENWFGDHRGRRRQAA